MHPIFSVSNKDIQSLNDTQARELIARLAQAEALRSAQPLSAVTWGGDQRAKDGGVDVRVDLPNVLIPGSFLEGHNISFQVKAESFPPSKIGPEMSPGGRLRPAIIEIGKDGGTYIIVSTRDSVSHSALTNRIAAMKKCLVSHGLTVTPVLDFYDARRVADWVEQHPAIVNWLKFTIGKPLSGWQPFGPWAYKDTEVLSQYLIDDDIKVFSPENEAGATIQTAINDLRGNLSKNSSVRLTGLSGVGKTRLAQALFDARIKTANLALAPSNVLYTDISDGPTPQPGALINALRSTGSDSIVIVDNCSPEMHRKLTEEVKKAGCQLKLLTIEYDVRDDLPEETISYRLEGSSDKVIEALLRRRFSFLSNTDISAIIQFSDGNARVAFALAFTSNSTDEIGRLQDDELFNRLFNQKNLPDNELLRCAEVASLLYSFDGEDLTEGSELALLSEMSELSVRTFTRKLAELKTRGLLQSRGQWKAILPHAIANRLAQRALASGIPNKDIEKLRTYSERVARSFSRRLSYLPKSSDAKKIATSWLVPGGFLQDLRTLDDLQGQVFANIAPIAQSEALGALERAANDAAFTSTENTHRDRFLRLARSLAYEPELFDRAATVLVKFALSEPINDNHVNARDCLNSLFQIHLSGTNAPPSQRSNFLRILFSDTRTGVDTIAIGLMKSALKAAHFTSNHQFDFGARQRGYGWHPRNAHGVNDWYEKFVDLALELGVGGNISLAKQSKILLGEAFRDLVSFANVFDIADKVAQKLIAHGPWVEGWLGVNKILYFDSGKIVEPYLSKLHALKTLLEPKNLAEEITAKVLSASPIAYLSSNKSLTPTAALEQTEQELENLGKAAALEDGVVVGLLPQLLFPSGKVNTFSFGRGVGQEHRAPNSLLSEAKKIVLSKAPDQINPIFLRGFLSGWATSEITEVNKFLDDAVGDAVWGAHFPELQVRVELDERATQRLIQSSKLAVCTVQQFRYLGFGNVTSSLTVEQIFRIIRAITDRGKEGIEVAVDVLNMVVFCAKDKDDDYRMLLQKTCLQFFGTLEWPPKTINDQLIDYLSNIFEFAVSNLNFSQVVDDNIRKLMQLSMAGRPSYPMEIGIALEPFFKRFSDETLNVVCVPGVRGDYATAIQLVKEPSGDDDQTALRVVPDEDLIRWCNVSPSDRYIFAANVCAIFNSTPLDAENGIPQFSDVAVRILQSSVDRQKIFDVFVERLQPTGYSGSLSEILRKRLPMIEKLASVGDKNFRVDVNSAVAKMKQIIASQERLEDQSERQTGTFE